ncbi:MAG: beta-lactamase family protein, partial [Rhizobiales bacterium]|nr:beta-lactamase family protein [Hyphomicrobiales bacterium]
GQAAAEDTVFRIFSMTKAIGSTAAMILIDRGKLAFDTPVADVLPAFADIKVLDGFDRDTPTLRAPKTTATIAHLATHTSGFVYEFWNAEMPKYLETTGHPTILSGLKSSLMYPLAFDPGTRWDYGIGIDWLGQAVEAVDGRSIDVFCREEIFEPLRMTDTAFEPEGALASRLAAVKIRNEAGVLEDFELAPPAHPEFYGMGHALYSTGPDYLRFLRMFLNKGALDGARILSEAGVRRMLENHIGDIRIGKMVSVAPALTADVDLFPDIDKTHSFGFMRTEQDIAGRRHAGSQTWAGVCNTHFWFDPSADVAGLIMTQSLPFIEPRFLKTYDAFEGAVYGG